MNGSSLPLIRRIIQCWAPSMILVAIAACGCAPQWHYSYAQGEQERQHERQSGQPERDLLLFYKDHLDAKSGQMQDVLNSPIVKPLIAGKIRCMLVTNFFPNQRYMAQYGVDSAPALVVVHPDGSYHARQGLITAEQARDFLAEATGSGANPKTDIQILPVPEYYWHGSYEEAVALASRQNRSLFIVYKWWLSAESTELLNRLSQPRVRRQASEMAHCLLDWDYIPNRAHMAHYGVSKVPSMVIVRADGTYHKLVGLASVEQIIRFVVKSRSPGRRATPRRQSGITPAIHWRYNYERALATARKQKRNLFIFHHSVFVDASNRCARLLDQPEAAALLDETVCCRLDWVIVKNRETAARFGLTDPPGFVVLRPDGTYHARPGSEQPSDLSALLKAARHPGTPLSGDDG